MARAVAALAPCGLRDRKQGSCCYTHFRSRHHVAAIPHTTLCPPTGLAGEPTTQTKLRGMEADVSSLPASILYRNSSRIGRFGSTGSLACHEHPQDQACSPRLPRHSDTRLKLTRFLAASTRSACTGTPPVPVQAGTVHACAHACAHAESLTTQSSSSSAATRRRAVPASQIHACMPHRTSHQPGPVRRGSRWGGCRGGGTPPRYRQAPAVSAAATLPCRRIYMYLCVATATISGTKTKKNDPGLPRHTAPRNGRVEAK